MHEHDETRSQQIEHNLPDKLDLEESRHHPIRHPAHHHEPPPGYYQRSDNQHLGSERPATDVRRAFN